jgi:Tfp pilus assembly PilM family ATPase
MLNPFKEFFSPKFVVGLEIHENFIGAIQIFNSLKGPEIDRIAFKEVEDLEKIDEELEEFFRKEKLRGEMVITCLPTSRATIRQISLSFDNVKKLKKIIKYQMEPYVPYPIDDLVVDFLPPQGNRDILTVAVQKKLVSEHLEQLARANLESEAVNLDDFALYYLYKHSNEGNPEHPVSIINLGVGKMAVQMIDHDRLDFIRVLPDGTDNVEQLLETFRLYELRKPDLKLGEILLTGHGATSTDLAEKLSLQTKVKTTLWRPFDKIKHQLGSIETPLQAKMSVPLGLALSTVDPSTKGFDLRKEEFKISTSMDLKRMLIYMFSSILLLVGLLTFSLYHSIYLEEKRYTEMNKSIRQIFVNTFPETKSIAKGQEAVQMSQKIEEEISKSIWLEDFTAEETVLDVLMILTEAISKFSDVSINDLGIEGKETRLNGQSSSFETVDKLKENLTSSGYFKEIKLVGAKMDKKEKVVKFNFALEGKQ